MKTVVFLGGSITQGTGAGERKGSYADIVFEWLKEQYGNLALINLGSYGTDSEFALFRLKQQLKGRIPDLIFLEFAVNDRLMKVEKAARIFENLLRYLSWEFPGCACITLELPMEGFRVMDEVHKRIAGYYGVFSVNVNQVVQKEIGEKLYRWEDIGLDSQHPNERGHALYAAKIIEGLKQKEVFLLTPDGKKAPLYGEGWLYPTILLPSDGVFMGAWRLKKTGDVNKMEAVAVSDQAGDFFEIPFRGTAFALAVKMTADSGVLYCILDDKEIFEIDLHKNKSQFVFEELKETLPEGHHVLYARLKEKEEQGTGNEILIGGFGVNQRPDNFEGFFREETGKKLSIILACTGKTESLQPLLASITGQTMAMEELEIVAVNAGCSSLCREELAGWEEKYPDSVCLIEAGQELELSACYHLGLSYASGSYILFLEEQDSLCPDACQELFNTVQRTGADLVQFKQKRECAADPGCQQEGQEKTDPFLILKDRKQMIQAVYGVLDCRAKGKLIQRSLIERAGVRFLEGAADGEWMFIYPILFYAACVVKTDLQLWREGEGKTEPAGGYELTVRNVLFFLCKKGFYSVCYQELSLMYLIQYFVKQTRRYFCLGRERELSDKIRMMREIISAYFPDFEKNPYLQEDRFAALRELLELLRNPAEKNLREKRESWLALCASFLAGLE